jgi:prephenate dehydrogenase
VITPHDALDPRALELVEDLALDLEAVPVTMTADEHDASVALVSHVPQVISSLLARRLIDAPSAALGLAGGGLRDTTRIASSDPALWVQILAANAPAVAGVLRAFRDDLDSLLTLVEEPDAAGSRRGIAEALAGGNAGVARIPGKHGQDRRYSQLVVLVADAPGELARLLTDIGDVGVNMEDLRLEHSPGAPIGLAEISVLPETEARLAAELTSRGWKIAEAWQ